MNPINKAETAAGLGSISEDGVSARIEIIIIIILIKVIRIRITHFTRMSMQTQEYLEDFLLYFLFIF
jgi:hypothetical protein